MIDLQTTLSGGRIWAANEVEALRGEHGLSVGPDIAEGTGITLYASKLSATG